MQKTSNDALGRSTIEDFKTQPKTPIIVVLNDVRSAHNVGAIFRTCDSFAIEKIYLCGITPTPPNRDLYKTALGAEDSVEWHFEKNILELIAQLKSQSIHIIAIEQAAASIYLHEFEYNKNEKIALVFGNEIDGVAQAVMNEVDTCIELPQSGTKHSLNVSVSAGAVLWEFYKSHIIKK